MTQTIKVSVEEISKKTELLNIARNRLHEIKCLKPEHYMRSDWGLELRHDHTKIRIPRSAREDIVDRVKAATECEISEISHWLKERGITP